MTDWVRRGIVGILALVGFVLIGAGIVREANAEIFDYDGNAARTSLWGATGTPVSGNGGSQIAADSAGNLKVALQNTGAATASFNLAQVGGSNIALGNGTAAQSIPVTMQSAAASALVGVTNWGTVALGGAASNGNVDSTSPTTVIIAAAAEGLRYNPSDNDWERERNNAEMTALTSSARTLTTNSNDITNFNGRSLVCMLDLTTHAGASIQPSVQWRDALSGNYQTLFVGPAQTTTGNVTFSVGAGISASAGMGVVASASYGYSGALPRTVRVQVVHGNSNSATYSVGCSNNL